MEIICRSLVKEHTVLELKPTDLEFLHSNGHLAQMYLNRSGFD